MSPSVSKHDIETIACLTGFPEDTVERLYQDALQSLSAGAHIKGYIHVLAFKRVCQQLREMHLAEKRDARI